MRQGAQGWCIEMILRDRMGKDGLHMYTHDWFMSMYGKNRYNTAK